MVEAVNDYGANPGRGGHALAKRAKYVIDEARKKIADMFQAPNRKHVWFYQNATMAMNQVLLGFPFEKNDHVITTLFEHNSMIRPLEKLVKEKGITVTYVEPNEEGLITVDAIERACTERTKLFAFTHASNVTGALLPLRQLANLAKEKGIIFFLDASQTAGTIPLQMEEDCIDLLAFAGHKSMLGPQGTGVLISRKDYQLQPLLLGGTGSHSELLKQPEVWPERYEAGTLNTPGIAGLSAGLDEIQLLGLDNIRAHETKLMKLCIEQMEEINGISLFGPSDVSKRVAVIPFQMTNVSSHELAMILDEHYNIAVRAGLHCAPKAHEHLGTNDDGLVRISFGPYNTEEEVFTLIQALKQIAQAFNEI